MNNQTSEQSNEQREAAEQAAIEKRRERLKNESTRIIEIANTESYSALKCIHQLSVAGGATEATYVAIEQRIVVDQDPAGAYHLALLAQNTPDLPIDARQLIELVVNKGDNHQRLALLKNLPLPPVELIKEQILASDDGEAIGQMNAYLQINPEGYGSHHMLSSGQSDQIVPLSLAIITKMMIKIVISKATSKTVTRVENFLLKFNSFCSNVF
ncbi:hypothetical protein JCM18901_430 [Psychrobacter sp. JCM 18901]|uniref:hypothetical protein n=1 Tax=Psychrobacter sp. JCM 18901 TaxID=1298609 RepID=UPI000430D338|nr:hypothetical protein [Psychrobacter sp. JCM 18901]GAF54828.1 hypothetical protein JCM18901_430 [Psychrobacter sp. JCM 18901]